MPQPLVCRQRREPVTLGGQQIDQDSTSPSASRTPGTRVGDMDDEGFRLGVVLHFVDFAATDA
ncbi:MAG: hypothetical protein U0R78_09895 [Nocardioidaceae bacterium]